MARQGRLRKVDPKVNTLYCHIWGGEIEAAKLILKELGLEVTDGFGRTALINAVTNKQLSLITWLIEKGANLNHQDRNGYSALHFIAQNGEVALARLFLKKGANPNLIDVHGNTPLFTAVFNSKNEKSIVELLLRYKADPAIVNKYGTTAKSLYNTAKSLYNTFYKADIAEIIEK